jgi:hypothetical protein
MSRRALLIGIDRYDNYRSLTGCVADATRMSELVGRNEDGSMNYACQLLTSSGTQLITRAVLRNQWRNLFREFTGEALFYFSGHGAPSDTGGYLLTQDAVQAEPGLPMTELLQLATQSKAREVIIILDCCYSGDIGNVPDAYLPGGSPQAQLRHGMTILAASGPSELAKEIAGHGVFTSLVLGALSGGAADVRGQVSAASVYSYVEKALGPWDQRPLYKSYASNLSPIRRCNPTIPDALLRELPAFFPTPDAKYRLAPSYEFTDRFSDQLHVETFNKFKLYRDAHLLKTVKGDDLFFAAKNSNCVELTPLGKFYHMLASKNLL